MLLTIIAFLFVFAVITLVHEGGHLYFSKLVGIRVHEFGLGFGPTLWQKKMNNTVYKINLLPILGYVKIAGIDTEDPEEKATPESEKYYNKSLGARFLSIFSGPFMNLILGFIVFALVFMASGVPIGVTNEIAAISPGSEAARIGLAPGDKLLSIDGKSFEKPEEAIAIIHKSAGKTLALGIERQGQKRQIKAAPKYDKKLKISLIGFSLKPLNKSVNPLEAIYYGGQQTLGLFLTVLSILGRLIIGKLSLSDIAGPVGIAQITGQYAHNGAIALLSFLAFFSVNVAVLNLLPLPALDGGRIFFLLLELLRRKPISIEKENKVHNVGLTLLLALMAVLTVNDLVRLFSR